MPAKGEEFREKGHFCASRRTNISRERPFLCQPEDGNFPEMAIFMPAEGQIFREKDHFLPTGGQEFPENGQFCTSRKTEKMNPAAIFFARLGNLDQNSSPERQEIRKNFRKNWKRSYMFTNRTGIFPCSTANDITEIPYRRDIFAQDGPHFLCFLAGKRTFYPAETYGSRLENLRFPHRKHRKQREKERLSCRHFQNTKHRRNKRTVYRKRTEKPHTEKQGK